MSERWDDPGGDVALRRTFEQVVRLTPRDCLLRHVWRR
jgi:hypothetical protein